MILRTATSADVDALLDVQEPGAVKGLGHIFPQDQHPFPREAIGSRWLAEIADPKINVYVYTEHDETIRGFAAVRDHETPALRHRTGYLGNRPGLRIPRRSA